MDYLINTQNIYLLKNTISDDTRNKLLKLNIRSIIIGAVLWSLQYVLKYEKFADVMEDIEGILYFKLSIE